MKWNEDIFRKNDIRGIYKKDFDLHFVHLLAGALCQLFKKPLIKNQKVVLGHDSRLSSPEIATKLKESLNSFGIEVVFLGLVPSPLCLFASYFKDIPNSIIVTASHNPPSYNGFKINVGKENICDDKMEELKKILKKYSSFALAPKPSSSSYLDISTSYINFYKKKFLQLFSKKHSFSLSIALDFGNGTSGPLALKFLKNLNPIIKFIPLFDKPDGKFPNHLPDPSNEANLKILKKTVIEKKCDFGVAFDGDGDRLYVIDQNGSILKGDELMFIFISDLLHFSTKKLNIVSDVKCGDWFFKFLKKQNISYTIWKSGHSLIRKKTIEKKAVFGGEFSSHFFFCDKNFPIDDGLYTLLRLIEIICFSQNKNLQSLKPKTGYFETNEIRKKFKDRSKAKIKLNLLKNFYKQKQDFNCLFIDGVRVSSPSAWGLARLSNTQKEWTLRFGGKTKIKMEKIKQQFFSILFSKALL